ncbi:general substrate transporter [Lipomyces oligophaga]|uniref:general substrate transporter n=1 Tax=Lipomyces oligophaga TaxID=45792 RepID=UPI0034CE6AA6
MAGSSSTYDHLPRESPIERLTHSQHLHHSGEDSEYNGNESIGELDGTRLSNTRNDEDNLSSSDEVDIEDVDLNTFIFLLTILVSFSGFLFGYDTGYISAALIATGTDLGREITAQDKEVITSATSFGAFLGAVIGGSLADTFGRKWVIFGANVLFIIGALTQANSHAVTTMVEGRFVMGWGVGIASLVAPLYISEMAPGRFRGRLVIINSIAITGGQVIAYILGALLGNRNGGWRVLVGIGTIPALTQMIVFTCMPETPRFLIRESRLEEAKKVIRLIYSPRKGVVPEHLVIKKLELLQEFNSDEHRELGRLAKIAMEIREIFSVRAYVRSLVIACGLQAIQQCVGFNSMMYFAATLFEMVGFKDPATVSLAIAGTNLTFTVVAFTLIDRLGRRRMLLSTLWVMAVMMVVSGLSIQIVLDDIARDASSGAWPKIVLLAMVLYVAFYAMGIGNVPWQQSELFPMQVRGVGTSMATATNWGTNMIVSATFLTLMDTITPGGTFVLYALMCLVGETLVYFFYPETSYLTLEDIQGLFEDGFGVERSLALSREARRHYESAGQRNDD